MRLGCFALALSLTACGGDDGGTPVAANTAASQALETPQSPPQPQLPPSQSQSPAKSTPPSSSPSTPPTSAVPSPAPGTSNLSPAPDTRTNDETGPRADESARIANRAPTIAGAPAESAPSGRVYEFRPTAHDPDGDALTYSIAGLPRWATFSEKTGELRGAPGNGHVGTYENIVISVSDGRHTVSLSPFRIDVRDGERASITLNWLPPTEDASGKPLSDLAGYKIYWGSKHGDYPNQVTIENPGVASYVLERLAPGKYYIVLTAFNLRGEESGFSNVVSNAL